MSVAGLSRNGADAGKGQIYSEEAAMTARRSWQLTLNNDIKPILAGAIR